MSTGTSQQARSIPWGDVLLSAIAAVSWALIGMAGTAALGLHLLEADSAGSLGPMTAAVVALGAGGSVTPSGDVSVFGLEGAQATTAIQISPLGVGLVGALLLSWFFLRSLRGAGVVIAPAELIARAGAVVVLFVALLGGLAWAGHSVITLDGGSLGLDDMPGGDKLGGVEVPGLGDIGGLLPDRLGDLVDAKAKVGFTVDTASTLLGGLTWCAGVLVIALLASRRTPLPPGWDAVHRVVRPAVSALVSVLLMAVLAGFAAAAYAAIGDDNPRRIAGAALVGAPNGVWLGIPIGLFVPWDGKATGELAGLLPDPLDELLRPGSGQSVTLGRLAELDSRVWLLGVGAALMMVFAGVLTAVRTPFAREPSAAVAGKRTGADGPGGDALGLAGRCALRLGIATALALPLLAWLTEVSVDASLSVLGFDAFGAGIELHGHLGMALLLGVLWGAGAGAAGALLAYASGAAGRSASPWAHGSQGSLGAQGSQGPSGAWGTQGSSSGPYTPSAPYRPPNPDTNPYLRWPDGPPDGPRGRGGGSGHGVGSPQGGGSRPGSGGPGNGPDVYGAPTVARPVPPPPRRPPQRPRSGSRDWPEPPPPPDDVPPPPPQPPRPRGR
ncbi:streptophobe family protein [Streptomyces sp. NPDC046862]|uniref:streptophobe family protein n=1 Tax=Streptomyces sp. NPDC046862 TaxID=3154603 RepID=UPI00345405FA